MSPLLKRHNNLLSIVVPYVASQRMFEDTLASILRYRPENAQVIVVHGGDYQDPHQLEDEVDFVVASSECSLGGQLGAALRISEAPFVALIRPGVLVDEGWQDSVVASFDDALVASVTPLIVDENSPRKVIVAGVDSGRGRKRMLVGNGVRVGRKVNRLRPLGPTSWAAFYRRSAIDLLGTPDAELDSMYFDLDLALGFQKLGFRNVVQQECVVTAEAPELIAMESSMPHGKATARAKVRFGDTSSTLVDSLLELLATPFKPWLAKHVLGKFGSKSMQQIDEAYARRLQVKAEQLAEPRVESIPMPQFTQDEVRRAA